MSFKRSKLGLSVVAIIGGIIVSMLSCFFENVTEGGMIGARGFGYPWPWRLEIIHVTTQDIYRSDNLAADMAFWSIICFIVLIVIERIMFSRSDSLLNNRKFVLTVALLPPLALLMGLIHEAGHAAFGTAIGGTLGYMQVAYFVVYPKLAIASQFQLGSVIVTGLSTSTQHGLFLLAGSLTTNIVAWLIGILINTINFSYRSELVFKILGYFGLLDLPFYVVLPLLGLRHWILLGETQPEPLIGARELGIPDPIFYTLVIIITSVLILLYSRSVRTGLINSIKHMYMRLRDSSARFSGVNENTSSIGGDF